MESEERDLTEKELLDSYELGEWKSIPKVAEEIQRYRSHAAAMIGNNARMNVSVTKQDLRVIEERAKVKGVSIQSLIEDIIRDFAASKY